MSSKIDTTVTWSTQSVMTAQRYLNRKGLDVVIKPRISIRKRGDGLLAPNAKPVTILAPEKVGSRLDTGRTDYPRPVVIKWHSDNLYHSNQYAYAVKYAFASIANTSVNVRQCGHVEIIDNQQSLCLTVPVLDILFNSNYGEATKHPIEQCLVLTRSYLDYLSNTVLKELIQKGLTLVISDDISGQIKVLRERRV